MCDLGRMKVVGCAGLDGLSSAYDKRVGCEDHQRKERKDVESEKIRLPRKTLINSAAILRRGHKHKEPPIIHGFLLKRITENARMQLRVSTLQLASVSQNPNETHNPRYHKNGNEEWLKRGHLSLPNATDETRAGERGMSPFELLKMLSGAGTYDLGHIPRVVSGRLVGHLSAMVFVL